MTIKVVLSVMFLLIIGLVMVKGISEKDKLQNVHTVYSSNTVQFILRLSIWLFIGYAGFMLFYDWKLFLVLLFVGILTAKFTTVPLWHKFFSLFFTVPPAPKKLKKGNK